MFLKSLSGRFLLLTIIFVMLAEVLIFVPSVARFREDYLQARLERSQIASLALLAAPTDMVDDELEAELLRNADVLNVVLRRDAVRQLVLASPMRSTIEQSYDLRNPGAMMLMGDAMMTLAKDQDRVIRVIGEPVKEAGQMIEVTMYEKPLRDAMIEYGLNILKLSAFISAITAALLFIAVRILLVRPIDRLVSQMRSYAANPEDVRKIIQPQAGAVELREAETALQSLQTDLSQSLKQKGRLADLGGAVARISHDLRNILTTTQLLADRMEMSDDPQVKKTAPKLINSLSRAVNLCESTLSFGKAEETPPQLTQFAMTPLLAEVVEGERLAVGDADVRIRLNVERGVRMFADREQLYRIVSNIVRNARQVLALRDVPGEIRVSGAETTDHWTIEIADNGPGLPKRAVDNLFTPFEGGARKGGSGLGLAISADLVKGHGGALELVSTGENGTVFMINLPKSV
ncbi:HAMP domain-containing histidine kinase [Amylibacter sp. SFDW26]|uniref:sensor histidine kinase n=1 Tax=Amylibacter sp. SFDW26 TaxID=2652722 RepID=UPI00126255FE|nr:HAMP domain-containing sensor histidine kinase [Amylibacter sp. SFDW26]KAB7613311.1 HAMP domain-containing histidine kinase [Amylibacter sp. SFDW26]